MPIQKNTKPNFVSIPNDTARDRRISVGARGVLAFILSHTDEIELSSPYLQRELGIGGAALRTILKELRINGYLSHSPKSIEDNQGKFAGQIWYVFAESQSQNFETDPFRPNDGSTVLRKTRTTVEPNHGPTVGTVNQQDNKEIKSQKKKILEENKNTYMLREAAKVFEAEVLGDNDDLPPIVIQTDFPMGDLYDAFPYLTEILTTAKVGMIVAAVAEDDKAAWLATIEKYRLNHDPRINRYMPDKVGNLLDVFVSIKGKMEREALRNGGQNGNQSKQERAIEDWANVRIVDQH